MLNEDAPDKLGRDRKEVSSILPLHALVIYKAHIGFVDESRGLEAVAGALAPHVAAGQAVELLINDGREFFQGGLIAFAPGAQQLGNATSRRRFLLCGFLHAGLPEL